MKIFLLVIVLINILTVPGPSTSTTVQPCIIDLTRSSSPPVGRTSPVNSRTYADVGTSAIPSPLPLNEKSFALIRGKYLIFLHDLSNDDGFWIASPRSGSDSFSPYPSRSSSAHTIGTLFSFFLSLLLKHNYVAFFYLTFLNNISKLVNADPIIFIANGTTTSPDTVSTALTQDNLELAYPIPMDEDTVDSTEPVIDSQTSSTINTNNSEAVSRTQKNTALSNASVTTTKAPHVETTTAVHLSLPSDLASPKDAQNSQNTTLDGKNNKPADIHHARLLNVTPGEFLFFVSKNIFLFFLSSFTAQLCRTANYGKGLLDELI